MRRCPRERGFTRRRIRRSATASSLASPNGSLCARRGQREAASRFIRQRTASARQLRHNLSFPDISRCARQGVPFHREIAGVEGASQDHFRRAALRRRLSRVNDLPTHTGRLESVADVPLAWNRANLQIGLCHGGFPDFGSSAFFRTKVNCTPSPRAMLGNEGMRGKLSDFKLAFV
jgi:hypothetical protein